ncbi:MAG TPA: hypothetical protein VFI31_16365 [Pirellulales bacterium]|nr:hypothetical protein [Pirellulales bacterium]
MSFRNTVNQPTAAELAAEALDLCQLEEKLSHVRRLLDDTNDASGNEEPPSPTLDRAAWWMTKMTIAAGTCSSILIAWSLLRSRQDLLAPAVSIGVLGCLAWFAGWCFSQTGRAAS